ncbi:MAG: PadR family transcriptional regulator [Candidatus Omnitrophota bacterium]|nr:PadR family transcriptional regulator [Candidatus Omnitrophota bacterium]
MNIQKLIILGILKEGPKHGYQIKKIIQNKLGLFSSFDNKSIYYPLKVMEKKGFIQKETDYLKGHITRHVYSITPAGNKEFSKEAKEALLSQKRPFIEIDIPLYFLPYLDKREVLARLKVRKRFLEKVKQWLLDKIKDKDNLFVHQRQLLKHHLNLLAAEDSFLDDILKSIKATDTVKTFMKGRE